VRRIPPFHAILRDIAPRLCAFRYIRYRLLSGKRNQAAA